MVDMQTLVSDHYAVTGISWNVLINTQVVFILSEGQAFQASHRLG